MQGQRKRVEQSKGNARFDMYRAINEWLFGIYCTPIHIFIRSTVDMTVVFVPLCACLGCVHTPQQTSYANSFVVQHFNARSFWPCWLIVIIQKCSVKFKLFCSGPPEHIRYTISMFLSQYKIFRFAIGKCLRRLNYRLLLTLSLGDSIVSRLWTK